MKKKIVFVINYFYPDFASTGQLMTELCMDLQNDFDITVIAAQPEGQPVNIRHKKFEIDYLENLKVIRIQLPKMDKSSKFSRIKYIFFYFILAFFALFREKKVDIIYSISTPPILGGLLGTFGKFFKSNCKHVYNIQDFNPEQAEAVNYTSKQFIFNFARKIDNLNCKYADHVVLVGNDMKETLNNRLKNKNIPNHSVVNNWTNEEEIIPLERNNPAINSFLNKNNLNDKFIVMYSGNLGLYYDLENIIKTTSYFRENSDIIFVFIGDGGVKNKMVDYIKSNKLRNVVFLPFQAKDFLKYSLNCADLHLVVNQKGIKGVSVPSKIYGVMAAGKPILGVLEKGSEAELLIGKSKCGIVVEPQDYEGIKKAISYFYEMKEEDRKQMGLNGRNYLEKNLKKVTSINKYRELLNGL